MNNTYLETEKGVALQIGGKSQDFSTMRQAVVAWRGLPEAQRRDARIIILGKEGRVLHPDDIERLEQGARVTIPLEELNAENDE